MLCRSVLSSAEYHNRKETEIGTVSLKKGELVDFEAHLVGRSRNAAKPRVKRGRKSTLTADRMEKLLGCVRRGLSNKDACMVAGISETTFYRWIEKGKHAKRGLYREFWDSLQAAHAHFQKFHLKAIARSSLEETQSTREVIEYEGGEVVTLPDGKRQIRPGKVKSVRLEIHTHPPTPKGSMWLLAHRFPDKWGRRRTKLPAADANAYAKIVLYIPDDGRSRDSQVSLKEGDVVDFEAHPVGRSRNTAKPRAKRGRKSKLTTDRMEMFLECVRYGSTNKDACMVARISETTLYRWIEKGKHAKRGPHRKFCDSLETALAHFQYVHLQAIERCSLEETQSTREVIEYEGGEVVTLPDGKRQLRPGKVKSVRREIRTHPPTLQGLMWLLERRFPDKWGPPRKELPAAGAKGKAVTYYLPDNGRSRDSKLKI